MEHQLYLNLFFFWQKKFRVFFMESFFGTSHIVPKLLLFLIFFK